MEKNKIFKRMMIFTIAAIMCLTALAFFPTTTAATINVPGDYTSLQAAIDAAGDGDTIMVSSGTYGISGQINQDGYSTAILIKDKNDLTIQAAPGQEPVVKPVATGESNIVSISIENCDNLIIDNIDSDQTVAQFDNWHVFNSDFLTLRNSEFQGGEDGIDFNTALNTALIENNIFKDITTGNGDEVLDFTDAACTDVTIQDNFFDYNYRHMTLDNGDSNFIIRNNIMDGTNSQEAVRLIDASNILIENNVIMNNMQQGVYIDSGCSDITIQHNSFFNNDQEGGPNGEIRTKILTADIIIKNNIIYGNGLNTAFETTATSLPGEDYNCVFNTADIGSFIFGPNTLTAQDPKFISTTAGSEDLHLQDSSPCIDSGLNLGVTEDLESNLRDANPDIGAYEYIEPCVPDIQVNTGYDPDAACSNGARWRNFKFNHNGWDMAVGANIGDAGSVGIDWSHCDWNIANNYYFTPDGPNIFTYTYDAGTGLQTIESVIDGGTFSQTHNNGNLGTLNYLQFDVVGRNGQTVEFNNVVLSVDGTDYNLCNYEAGGWKTWYIDSLDLTNGFSITGEVYLTGQSTCQECSKINICVGSSCTPICRNIEDNIEFCTIQDAIDASTTDDGETIEVYAGTFIENATSFCDIDLYKDVSLIGQGSGSTIIELTEGKSEGLQITGSNPTDIIIEGITFTRQSVNPQSSNEYIQGSKGWSNSMFDFTQPWDCEGTDYFGWNPLKITTESNSDCTVSTFTIEAPTIGIANSPGNFWIEFDSDNDGTADFQISWHNDETSRVPTDSHWGYRTYNGGWSGWIEPLPTWFTGSKNGDRFIIEIDGDYLGNENGIPDDCGEDFGYALFMVIPDEGFNQNVCDPGESWPGECVVIPAQGSVYFIEETLGTVSTNASKRAVRVFSDLDSLTLHDVVVEYAEVNNMEINGNIGSLSIDDSILHYAGVNGLMCPGDIGSGSITDSHFDYNGRLDVWASGMHLFGLISNLDIIGCSMSHNTDSGFNGRQLSNIYFEDCTASYNTHSGGGYGIAISEKATSSSDITMIDITAEHNGRDGIMIWAWYDYCSISDVTITGGLFTNNGWAGIRVLNWPASGSTGGTITNVEITEAQIENNPNAGVWFELDYVSSDATTSFVNYNNIIGNANYGILNSGDGFLDATCNWWGDNNGPSGVGPGSGDPVSNNVRYCPWLTDEYPSGDCTGGAICWNQDTGEYFCSIQAAIDDADTNDVSGDHDTIEVFAVTTIEQVNVYKSVTIYGQGIGNTIIQSPETLTDYFTTSNDNYPIVYINNVDDVIIHNLTVDGAGKGNSNYRFIGIAMYQAGATLKDLEVLNVQDTPFSGAQHGTGIYAWVDSMGSSYDVVVQDCVVEDFQKNGITLSGSDLDVVVSGCTVNGKGPTDVTAQNGIQVSHGASGSIMGNTVSGCSYVGDYWAASGILPYFADGVLEISDNVISENQANIYLGACSADITDNTITSTAAGTQQDYFYGIIGDPGDPPIIPDASPFDEGTPPVDRATYEITCTGNDVIGDGSSSSTGIGVYAGMYGTYDIEFIATNNNVNDWGFGFELYAYGSNELISADINYNNIVGNDFGIYNWLSTTFDCECNWYGDPLGPTHIDNPSGSGDSVSDFIDYLPWLNLPFEDPNSICGAGLCQDIVYVDDDFTSSTPGWYVDHFPTIQIALDRLSADGTAIIADGIYDEDLIIDDDNCDNTGITIKGAYECFPTDEAAVIKGNMLISVSDVTIHYLEFTPTVDAAITIEDGVSGTVLQCNKFRRDCVADAMGVQALGGSVVDAELNWWGAPDGPCGGLMDDGKLTDGFGVKLFGDVMVEPWVGVHAEISEPVGTIEIEVGDAVSFDALGSFAYSFGDCCEPTEIHKQFLWDFDDGLQSSNRQANHVFDQPGTFEVSLMVDAVGIAGLFGNFMYDWDYVTVHVVAEDTPLTVNADGENLGGYETLVGEPVQLFGDAFAGDGEYYWSWSFGDNSGTSSEQNPVHTYDSAGTYMVELTVTSGGESASDTAEVVVYDLDELRVSLPDGSGVQNSEMLFAASVSGGYEPYSYVWDFGDGSTSAEVNPSHVYTQTGTFMVTVSVTDSRGQSRTTSAEVVVEEDTSGVEPVEIVGMSGGLFLKADISAGDSVVVWSITVDGMVLFGGSDSGDLPAGVTESVRLPLTIGFGNVDITVVANDVSEEYTAFLIGPFFFGLTKA